MWTVACVLSTTANGSPYGGLPKSGWRFVLPEFIEASHALLFGFTGSFEMSAFQMLSAGNTLQVVPGTGAAARRGAAGAPEANAAETLPTRNAAVRAPANRRARDRRSDDVRGPIRSSAMTASSSKCPNLGGSLFHECRRASIT